MSASAYSGVEGAAYKWKDPMYCAAQAAAGVEAAIASGNVVDVCAAPDSTGVVDSRGHYDKVEAAAKAAETVGVGEEWNAAVAATAEISVHAYAAAGLGNFHVSWLRDSLDVPAGSALSASARAVRYSIATKKRLRRYIADSPTEDAVAKLEKEKKSCKMFKARVEVCRLRLSLMEKVQGTEPVFPKHDMECAGWNIGDVKVLAATLTEKFPHGERGVVRGDGVLHPGFVRCSAEILGTVLAVMDLTAKATSAMVHVEGAPPLGFTLSDKTSYVCNGNQLRLIYNVDDASYTAEVGVTRTKDGKALCINAHDLCMDLHKKREVATGAAGNHWSLTLGDDAAALLVHLTDNYATSDSCKVSGVLCEHDGLDMAVDLVNHFFFSSERMLTSRRFRLHTVESVRIYQVFFHELFTKSKTTVETAILFFKRISQRTESNYTPGYGFDSTNFMQAIIGQMWSHLALQKAINLGSGETMLYSDTDFAKTVYTTPHQGQSQIGATEPEDGIAAPSAGKRSRT